MAMAGQAGHSIFGCQPSVSKQAGAAGDVIAPDGSHTPRKTWLGPFCPGDGRPLGGCWMLQEQAYVC